MSYLCSGCGVLFCRSGGNPPVRQISMRFSHLLGSARPVAPSAVCPDCKRKK